MTNEWVTEQLRNRARTLPQVSSMGPAACGAGTTPGQDPGHPNERTSPLSWMALEALGEQPLLHRSGDWEMHSTGWPGYVRSERCGPKRIEGAQGWAFWAPEEKDHLSPEEACPGSSQAGSAQLTLNRLLTLVTSARHGEQ